MASAKNNAGVFASISTYGNSGSVQQVVRNMWLPTIVVVTSKDADTKCLELFEDPLVDVLQAGILLQRHVSWRGPNDRPYEFSDFRVRVVSSQQYLSSASPASVVSRLDSFRQSASTVEYDITRLPGNSPRVPKEIDREAENDERTSAVEKIAAIRQSCIAQPWISTYMSEFISAMPVPISDSLNHAVAILFVGTTNEPVPTAFESFKASQDIQPLHADMRDANVLRFIMLLHDSSSVKDDRMSRVNSELTARFAKDCCAVDISSALPIASRVQKLIDYMPRFVFDHFWPHMLNRVNVLSEEVGAQRKGFMNSFTAVLGFGRRGTNTTMTNAPNPSPATLVAPSSGQKVGSGGSHSLQSAVAGQSSTNSSALAGKPEDGWTHWRNTSIMPLRRVADLCFLCRMYDIASTHYRTLGNETKSDRALRGIYASAQECLALSQFLEDGRDVRTALELAADTYRACGMYDLSVRCSWILSEWMTSKVAVATAREPYNVLVSFCSATSDVLVRCAWQHPDRICQAILLDRASQIALCGAPIPMPRTERPMVLLGQTGERKARMYRVLAGMKYADGGVLQLAYANCLRARYTGWAIDERVESLLSRLAFPLHRPLDSVALLTDLIQHLTRSALQKLGRRMIHNAMAATGTIGAHSSYVVDYMAALRAAKDLPLTAVQLPVPFIEPRSIRWHTADTRRKEWRGMERAQRNIDHGRGAHTLRGQWVMLMSSVMNPNAPVPYWTRIAAESQNWLDDDMVSSPPPKSPKSMNKSATESLCEVNTMCNAWDPLALSYLVFDSKKNGSVRADFHNALLQGRWPSDEDIYVPTPPKTDSSTYGLTQSPSSWKEVEVSTASVGELVYVEFVMWNQLRIPLQLTRMRLLAAEDSDSSCVESEPIDFLLGACEVQRIRLSATVRKVGRLTLRAVGLVLCGVIDGEIALGSGHVIEVGPPRGLLDVSVQGLPPHILTGSLHTVSLLISNVGPKNLRRLRLRVSDPSFVVSCKRPSKVHDSMDNLDGMGGDLLGESCPPFQAVSKSDTCSGVCIVDDVEIGLSKIIDPCTWDLTEWISQLGPGQSARIPVVLYGARAHSTGCEWLLLYESEWDTESGVASGKDGQDAGTYIAPVTEAVDFMTVRFPDSRGNETVVADVSYADRVYSLRVELSVRPALRVTVQTSPSIERHWNYPLSYVDVQNIHAQSKLSLDRVLLCSKNFAITLPKGASDAIVSGSTKAFESSATLSPMQSWTSLLRLVPADRLSHESCTACTLIRYQRNVRLYVAFCRWMAERAHYLLDRRMMDEDVQWNKKLPFYGLLIEANSSSVAVEWKAGARGDQRGVDIVHQCWLPPAISSMISERSLCPSVRISVYVASGVLVHGPAVPYVRNYSTVVVPVIVEVIASVNALIENSGDVDSKPNSVWVEARNSAHEPWVDKRNQPSLVWIRNTKQRIDHLEPGKPFRLNFWAAAETHSTAWYSIGSLVVVDCATGSTLETLQTVQWVKVNINPT